MSAIFPHFTKQNPCPSCGGHDWTCRAGSKKYICMRIESNHPSKDGGWFHEYGGKKSAQVPPKRFIAPPKVKMDFNEMAHNFFVLSGDLNAAQLKKLGNQLGVSWESLASLFCGYSKIFNAWAIPMRDGDNKIIGIHLRCDDGSKKCVTGSQGGLFIPQVEPQKIAYAYICEGASSTAALLTLGFFAIGRFNCNTGGDMLKIALKRLGVTRIVIVADNDTLKTAPNGKTFRPGQDGASRLKKELGLMSVICTCPNPVKDCRQLLQKLGVESARNYITNSVGQKIWTKV